MTGTMAPVDDQADSSQTLDPASPLHFNASIFYMKPDPLYNVEKPYFMNIPLDPTWVPKLKQTNVAYTRKTVAITDIRGHEDVFTLDQSGFELGTLRTGLSYDDFAKTDTIVSRFYDEVKVFLKQYTGAAEVLPFDFQVRRKDPTLPPNSRGAPGKAQPFAAVHGDQTTKAAIRRLKYFHPIFAEKYADGRFQIINVWKPLRGPVYNSPLAVCDYRTVKQDDLPNANHRFYYVNGQETHEAWMIKCFDSATATDPKIAQFSPHVSFPYTRPGPGSAKWEDSIPRESVEVRSFVFRHS
ncbi:hypothetical protein B0T24DRAFT_648779 [Lasiosphaeria ovina]|uniref:7alpha-cephem-methoxylase P8 chain n=1 Tax=Lasiosphaeria ovina TaxID=92902 RepID=A0AAE0KIC5_9PEZI|nr:hypothetical protein B0T24DRAFT_648779 [Lasiosphaeria ovina]